MTLGADVFAMAVSRVSLFCTALNAWTKQGTTYSGQHVVVPMSLKSVPTHAGV